MFVVYMSQSLCIPSEDLNCGAALLDPACINSRRIVTW